MAKQGAFDRGSLFYFAIVNFAPMPHPLLFGL
ncbi:MAG: hypothetical protein ACJA1T_001164 [Zhongshania aliphaticivorans]|jgi:hypothetical protein